MLIEVFQYYFQLSLPAVNKLYIVFADDDPWQPLLGRLAHNKFIAHAAANPAKVMPQPWKALDTVGIVPVETFPTLDRLRQTQAHEISREFYIIAGQRIETLEINIIARQQETLKIIFKPVGLTAQGLSIMQHPRLPALVIFQPIIQAFEHTLNIAHLNKVDNPLQLAMFFDIGTALGNDQTTQ